MTHVAAGFASLGLGGRERWAWGEKDGVERSRDGERQGAQWACASRARKKKGGNARCFQKSGYDSFFVSVTWSIKFPRPVNFFIISAFVRVFICLFLERGSA